MSIPGDYMIYKEALTASGYTVIKTEELEKLRAELAKTAEAMVEGVELVTIWKAKSEEASAELAQLRFKIESVENANRTLRVENNHIRAMWKETIDNNRLALAERDKTVAEARIVIEGIVDFGYEVTEYTMGNARKWLSAHPAQESEEV